MRGLRSERGKRGGLAEGAREPGEDAREAEAEAQNGAVGVGRAVAADGLHGLDEEAEAPHRRHVERERRRREGQRHEQLQHLPPADGVREAPPRPRQEPTRSWPAGRQRRCPVGTGGEVASSSGWRLLWLGARVFFWWWRRGGAGEEEVPGRLVSGGLLWQ